MREIVINQDLRQKKPRGKRLFSFALILSVIFSCIFLYVENFSVVNTLIGFHKLRVVYDTFSIGFDDSIPTEYKDIIKNDLGSMSFNGKERFVFDKNNPDIILTINKDEDNPEAFSESLIPVGHMYSILTGITEDSLKDLNVYVLDDTISGYIANQYGITVTKANSREELMSTLAESDDNIALVRLADIDFDMKILPVDGIYYLDNQEGGINLHFYASKGGDNDLAFSVMKKNVSISSAIDTSVLAKVNMSGVVALSRDLAAKMDSLKNYDYPAEALGTFLSDADLTHVSNEASFFDGCVASGGMRFCSKTEYFATLLTSGVDIVELTGNHNNDYGSGNNENSIEMYVNAGIKYFGGGLDDTDASKILYVEVKGVKIAFIGYNYYDTMLGTGAIASDTHAGANFYSEAKMKSNIEEARANADVVIVDFQFQECYCYPDSDVVYPICYKPLSSPDQEGTFRLAIDDGANIVIGTQAHQPQTYELYGDGVIFYGLGNLYFDQDIWIGTRQGLILTHYFYDGKYIQTKITPIYMDSSLQPDFATEQQAQQLMESLKEAR